MKKFEADVMKIAETITFRRYSNDLQKKMKADMKDMQNSNKTLTPADKTTNLYRLTKEEYEQLKSNAITATYKKGNRKIKEKIDKNGVKFAKKRRSIGPDASEWHQPMFCDPERPQGQFRE